jgi:HSP20 family protein
LPNEGKSAHFFPTLAEGGSMSIVRWNPMLTNALNRWPDIWDDDSFSALTNGNSNNLDVYETDNEVIVSANVAGVPEKNIDITFEKGVLWIKAEKAEEQKDAKKKHYARSSWNYSYKISVPGILDHTAEPKAEIKDGIITITFKKAEESKPRKLLVKKAA